MRITCNFLYFLAVIVVISMLGSCASLTGFQTGKTVGQGNGEFMATLNVSQTPKFDFDSDDTSEIKRFYFPNVELSGRYGVLERLDVGLRLNTNLNVAADARYQLLGNRESQAAMSVGFGAGTFGAFAALWYIHIPLYISFHPSENFVFYISPRYVAQFVAGDIPGHIDYLGGNAGILFGQNVKFGFDVGLYNLSVRNSNPAPIATFGFGVKVPFEGNRSSR